MFAMMVAVHTTLLVFSILVLTVFVFLFLVLVMPVVKLANLTQSYRR